MKKKPTNKTDSDASIKLAVKMVISHCEAILGSAIDPVNGPNAEQISQLKSRMAASTTARRLL